MATLQEQDDKVIAEWARIFCLSRKLRHSVQQSMEDAALFITEEYDIVHPEIFETEKEKESNKDVHTEHCCLEHGCKYGEDDCPVAAGRKVQSYPCESCGTIS